MWWSDICDVEEEEEEVGLGNFEEEDVDVWIVC